MKGKEKGLAHRDLNRGWKEVRRIERQMRDDILDRAQVLCCTCIGVGHQLLDGRRFSRVLLDEATQATEPASLVPLVRGASGMKMSEKSFLREVLLLCKKYGVISIFDEVMTGFGRTGTYFASNQLHTEPDIICLSKSLSGGTLPLSLTIGKYEIPLTQ